MQGLSDKAADMIRHMQENNNFLTLSESYAYPQLTHELKSKGAIVLGECKTGLYRGAEGYVSTIKVAEKVKKPAKPRAKKVVVKL